MTDPAGAAHMLSIDVEEYFHAEAARAAAPVDTWADRPSRLAEPMDRILAMLDDAGVTATFFILGWVARRDPAVVERIAAAGHEIGSHGMSHRMLGELSDAQRAAEFGDSRKLLQDLSGQPVLGYRAPTFSVTRRTAGALDALAEAGYAYDSSIFPVTHDRYGVPDAPAAAHVAIGPGGGEILEIPPLIIRALGRNVPMAGGGYLRLFPVRLIATALHLATRAGRPGMIYLHPWELDPGQPVLAMARLSRWRHRVGLNRTGEKLRWLLRRFAFTSAASLLDELRPLAECRRFRYAPHPAG